MNEKDARLARAILRVIQRNPEIQRTNLTVQIRSYGEDVFRVLNDLVARGIVVEDSKIVRPGAKNARAVIVYRLATTHPVFDDMDPIKVAEYLNALPATA